MKSFIFAVVMTFALTACGKSEEKKSVNTENKGGSVGPFDLTLSGEANEKPNTFSARIDQAEGAVDFYLPNGDNVQYLVLNSYSASVTGCDVSNVRITPVWYASENAEEGEILKNGSTMLSTPRTRSRLRIIFQGMGGCTNLDFSLVVRKLDVGQVQPGIDNRFRGIWTYKASPSKSVVLSANSFRVDWMQIENGYYTCDVSLSPMNSTANDGGWFVFDNGALICAYRFTDGIANALDLTCHGHGTYGCSLPSQFRFVRN